MAIDILITFPLIIEFHFWLQAQVVFAFLVPGFLCFMLLVSISLFLDIVFFVEFFSTCAR